MKEESTKILVYSDQQSEIFKKIKDLEYDSLCINEIDEVISAVKAENINLVIIDKDYFSSNVKSGIKFSRLPEMIKIRRPNTRVILYGNAEDSNGFDEVAEEGILIEVVHRQLVDNAILSGKLKEITKGNDLIVTGGLGYLGHAFIEKVLSEDKDVRVFLIARNKREYSPEQRMIRKFKKEYHERIIVVNYDVSKSFKELENTSNYQELINAKEPEIWHFAAMLSFLEDDRDKLFETNITGTAKVIELCRKLKHPPRSFNYISTAFVSGTNGPPDIEYEDGDGPTTFINPYEYSKRCGEAIVKSSNLPYRIFRPSTIIGDTDTFKSGKDTIYGLVGVIATSRNMMGKEHAKIKFPMDKDCEINYINLNHAVDMIEKAREAGEKSINKIFHLTNPKNSKGSDFFDVLEKMLNVSFEFVDFIEEPKNAIETGFIKILKYRYLGYLFKTSAVYDITHIKEVVGQEYIDNMEPVDIKMMVSVIGTYIKEKFKVEVPIEKIKAIIKSRRDS